MNAKKMNADGMGQAAPNSLRVDKWLWYARFFKTRSLAAKVVQAGIRVNQTRVAKAHFGIKPGDVLTFDKIGDVRVIRVEKLGERRGPFSEAQTLYTDLSPPEPKVRLPKEAVFEIREEGAGRPTKRDRRLTEQLKGL